MSDLSTSDNGAACCNPLAWNIAKRAKLDNPEAWAPDIGVRAHIIVAGTYFQGKGPTSSAAMRDLARIIEEWGAK